MEKELVFVLAGQSNMAGRAGLTRSTTAGEKWRWDEASLAIAKQCNLCGQDRILRLSAENVWEKAAEPLHRDIDTKKVCGIGPGLLFANRVFEQLQPSAIRLIPTAVGDTGIDRWCKGSECFERLVERAKACKYIDAVLWYQGESDALTQEKANCFQEKLEAFIFDVRVALNSPSLVFYLIVPVGDPVVLSHLEQVQDGVRKVANKVANCCLVDFATAVQLVEGDQRKENALVISECKTPALQFDKVHLSLHAQQALAAMLADAFLGSFKTQ